VNSNWGLISSSHASSTSQSPQSAGLVFTNQATGSIVRSYSTGAVANSGSVGGGLVVTNAGSITQSFSTASVSGDGYDYAAFGGLVAINYSGGTIKQSYARGSVRHAFGYGGSLVGYNEAFNLPVNISQSYGTGKVSFSGGCCSSDGGFAGGNFTFGTAPVTVTNSYWDTQSTGQPFGGVPGPTGLTTAQLRSGLPPGFDGPAATYPYLIFPLSQLDASSYDLGSADGTLAYQQDRCPA
jgi:hypothetical protein